VGPDRFDDVEYTMLEQPEPPRRPRRRRWMLAPLATVLAAGVLAAGASALTGGDRAPAPAPKGDAAVPQKPDYRDFRGCEKGERHGKRERSSSSELRH
jgi:hypothetical protein